jgi:ribose transport system ATP-binding protein
MDEIQRIADRITVLRDGQMLATHEVARVSLDQIVRDMVGRELAPAMNRKTASEQGQVALRVVNLQAGERVRGVSFEAYRGEILGFAGLMGSGRTETMRTLFGADPLEAGEIYLHGSNKPVVLQSPRDAVRAGIARHCVAD